MSQAPAMPMRTEHLAQLDAIDQTYWWHRVRWRVVRWCLNRFTKRREFARYFDIGSGGGGLPGLLAKDFAFGEVVLFDQHASDTRKCGQLNVTQQVIDLEAFDWSGVPAPDLITCLDVLEHLDEPQHLLQCVRARCGGRQSWLVVTVPAMASLWSGWDVAAGHRRRYSRAGLQRLLSDAGWSVAYCGYFFRAAVLPLWLKRRVRSQQERAELLFPELTPWTNALAERVFWWEFLMTKRLPMPFGSSLVAVAHAASGS